MCFHCREGVALEGCGQGEAFHRVGMHEIASADSADCEGVSPGHFVTLHVSGKLFHGIVYHPNGVLDKMPPSFCFSNLM